MQKNNIIEIEKLLKHIEATDHKKLRDALICFLNHEDYHQDSLQNIDDLHLAFENYIANVIDVAEKFKNSLTSFSKVLLEVKSH